MAGCKGTSTAVSVQPLLLYGCRINHFTLKWIFCLAVWTLAGVLAFIVGRRRDRLPAAGNS